MAAKKEHKDLSAETLTARLRDAGKRPVPFVFALSKAGTGHHLVLHKIKEGKSLLTFLRTKQPDAGKGTYGKATLTPTALMLDCEKDLPGMTNAAKAWVAATRHPKVKKIKVLVAGQDVGDDDDADDVDPLAAEWSVKLAEAMKLFKAAQSAESSGKLDRRALTGGAAILRQAKAHSAGGDFTKALASLVEFQKIVRAGMVKTTTDKPAVVETKRSPDETRTLLGTVDETKEESVVMATTAKALDDLKKTMTSDGKLVMVKDLDDLAEHFARENGGDPGSAKMRLLENKATGFTGGQTGAIYVLVGGSAGHDAVHEMVHVMSAPGGKTRIMAEFGEQFNEGFTEYFTKRMCTELGVQDAVAYPGPLSFVEKVATAIGHAPIYQAYMKDQGIDVVLDKLADRWISRDSVIPKSVYKPQKTKGAIDKAKCIAAIRGKLKNFPPSGTGPTMNVFEQGIFL